jgi:DNA-directed RNA polymerase specialized sigma24 family protein
MAGRSKRVNSRSGLVSYALFHDCPPVRESRAGGALMEKEEYSSKRLYFKDNNDGKGEWVDVPDDLYTEYMRYRDRTRKRMQGRGECDLPKEKFWYCDGDCVGCKHRTYGRFTSLDEPLRTDESGEDYSLLDVIGDPHADFEDKVVDKLYYRQIIDRLIDLYPEAITIGELRVKGKTDNEIAEIIGVNRTTFRSRIEKVKKQIYEEMGGNVFD